ncbi:response regulator [Cyclobacterium plantarum]|uniref:response regulator n=1 Tax=Cyclobacterium plantarum TaxID=2716263 RepID=UPI003F7284C8
MKELVNTNFDLGGKKLLVVEDDPIFGLIMKSIFKTWKNTITDFAVNGKEALEKLLLPGFDLVLMDLQMPVMDGFQTILTIRQGHCGMAYSNIPAIALTADISEEARQKGLSAGFNDFLVKPMDSAGLFATIEHQIVENAPATIYR